MTTRPFSIRFTPEERAFLESCANGRPLGVFIRALLMEHAFREGQVSTSGEERAQLALILAALGKSDLAANLHIIAEAARLGLLPSDRALAESLGQALTSIQEMRDHLLLALRAPRSRARL